MNSEATKHTGVTLMDSDKRIEELERQVRELTRQVQELRGTAATPKPGSGGTPKLRLGVAPRRRPVRGNVIKNVHRVLGGEQGEPIESRIGGIWLSRIAVVLLMTAIVLGARLTLYSEVIGPFQKLLIVYAASLCAIIYGIAARNSPSFFPQTLLGTGLAGVYFATYAAFFVDEMQLSHNLTLAFPLLIACLALLAGTAHWRRSPAMAGISLFLVYYTVVLSAMQSQDAQNLYYALSICAVLAFTVLLFHIAHRWLLFTWAALIATQVTYLYFFLRKPAGLAMSDVEYFWLSNGFLTICYVLFSCACIIDARKTGEYRRNVAPMSGVNSFVYLVLVWIAVRHQYIEQEWMFRLGLAAGLLGFAVLARITGPRWNYLFQIFIAKAVIMFTLALQAYFSGEMLMVAIAVECLALSFSYQRSGNVMFKVLEMALLIITFVGCLFHVRTPGAIALGAFTLRANWFCCAGSAIALTVVAWFYEHFVRRVKPEDRIVPGQWFLADSFLDVSSATAAILHAAAAAFILLAVTIIDRGNDPVMPYLLAVEGVLMAAAGVALRTPPVQVGGVLLLVASHVCYHAFLALGKPGFELQPHYAAYTVAVALFTYLGAYLWERYLRRVEGGKPWEHDVAAALPYLAATYMLTTLIARQFASIHVPWAQNSLGVVLLLVGVLIRYPGVKASGILALAMGAVNVWLGLYGAPDLYLRHPNFPLYFGLTLAAYVVSERLFVIFQHQERTPSKAQNPLRSLLIIAAVVLGVFGFRLYAAPELRTFYWLGLALVAVTLGAAFREARYRWAALILFAAAIIRAYSFDLPKLPPLYQFLSFAALSIPLLIISWVYARYRQKTLSRQGSEKDEG